MLLRNLLDLAELSETGWAGQPFEEHGEMSKIVCACKQETIKN
jgi:hypothetical protein